MPHELLGIAGSRIARAVLVPGKLLLRNGGAHFVQGVSRDGVSVRVAVWSVVGDMPAVCRIAWTRIQPAEGTNVDINAGQPFSEHVNTHFAGAYQGMAAGGAAYQCFVSVQDKFRMNMTKHCKLAPELPSNNRSVAGWERPGRLHKVAEIPIIRH